MSIELTVLGSSGSYGAPPTDVCSGYLVRSGDTSIWLDCGNGTLPNLQRHTVVDDLTAVVVTHRHPDHCVDLFGLNVLFGYGLERPGPPVFAAPEVLDRLVALSPEIADNFAWDEVDDGDARDIGALRLRFSRTDHPPPTLAVEASSNGKRLVYTSDTGPGWSVSEFGEGADLVLSEASYQDDFTGDAIHLTAGQAGAAAREAAARRLMITHLWPTLDPAVSVAQAEDGFGQSVRLATPHLRVRI